MNEMNFIAEGFAEAVFTYRCKWCERTEIITYNRNAKNGLSVLEGWRTFDYSQGNRYDLCSSDCEKEKDDAVNQALANLEPTPRGSIPKGFEEELERIRHGRARLQK